MDYSELIKANDKRWKSAKLTRRYSQVAHNLIATKAIYQKLESKTGVPWFVIAVIHERESSQDWTKSLAQGDPWNAVSTHIPKGRGPFKTWAGAAEDALVNCAPYAAKWKDWSAGGALTMLERYNGLGYFHHGIPSPYIWSGTDQYEKGKYIKDGVFAPDVVDQQPGCAALIMEMAKLDDSVSFEQKKAKTVNKAAGATAAGAGAGAVAQHSGLPLIAVVAIALLVGAAVYYFMHKGK